MPYVKFPLVIELNKRKIYFVGAAERVLRDLLHQKHSRGRGSSFCMVARLRCFVDPGLLALYCFR